MSASEVQFWFDFASSYSYVAAMRVEEEARRAGVPLVWKPFLLGPIFQKQGWSDSPFNLNPARGRYMWRDVQRRCEKHGIGFGKPSQFPRNSVLAARIACAAASQRWMPDYARGVFRANFAEDQDISRPDVLEGILARIGENSREWMERALSPENKGLLRGETDRAWGLGIFGAPTFVIGTELFWGGDRMEDAFAWYQEKSEA